jgi:small subunit ribosomal protein S18
METENEQEGAREEPQNEAPTAYDVTNEQGAPRGPRPSQAQEPFRPRGRGRYRRRVCPFCKDKLPSADYKDFNFLRRFVSDRGRIESRRKMGTCSKHQRAVARAVKRARHLALIPYTADHIRGAGVGLSR